MMPPKVHPELVDMTDGELAARLRRHPSDRDTWAELYRRCYPIMLRTAVLTLGSGSGMAEDVVQDVFARSMHSGVLSSLRDPNRVRYYLGVAARHAALDLLRSPANSRVALGLELEAMVDPESWEDHAAERRAVVQEALSRLPPEDAEILNRFIQGFTLSEIATELQLSYAAAAQRVSRARKRLLGQ